MRHTKIFQGFWTLEIASIVLSVGCVAAIAAILAVLENKPLSSWKLPWRPNSVVSFLAVVAKAALVFPTAQCISQSKWLYYQQKGHRAIDLQHFEDASRGPLGSFLFMLKFKPRTLVASFACALTVAALAVEIFVQQTIDYRSLAVSIGDASASTRVARRYDTGVGYSGSPNCTQLSKINPLVACIIYLIKLTLAIFSRPIPQCRYAGCHLQRVSWSNDTTANYVPHRKLYMDTKFHDSCNLQ